MKSQEHFQAQPSDIILSSAPKTGTTWLKALTFSIKLSIHRIYKHQFPIIGAISSWDFNYVEPKDIYADITQNLLF
ncbi:hypothetical protein VitviT2T_028565 [Vitis vinifera]|uniref:Sulfotransferase n=1 Tax=Vitis vinifera TaxID=29760 RepID=A0ABY9DTP4_VITVI|nr:hypothetical protein VitviT2T_028565 [Vitis vinifera]